MEPKGLLWHASELDLGTRGIVLSTSSNPGHVHLAKLAETKIEKGFQLGQ